jgi:hypothetical protein
MSSRLREEYRRKLYELEKPLELIDENEYTRETYFSRAIETLALSILSKLDDKISKVKVFWIDNTNVNASVIKIEDTYCIGLFEGVITSLKDHINTFYCSSVKDANVVIPSKDLYFCEFDDSTNQGKMANYIFTIAFYYIGMHEFGHILCGHCDDNSEMFYEIENKTEETTNGYWQQGKEYWADLFGTANSYSMLLASFHDSETSIQNFTTLYFAAIQSIFWIFNFNITDLKKCIFEKMTHPHPIIRMSYFYELVESELAHTLEIYEKHGEIELIYTQNKADEMIVNYAFDNYLRIVDDSKVWLNINDYEAMCDLEIKKIKESANIVKEYYRKYAKMNIL